MLTRHDHNKQQENDCEVKEDSQSQQADTFRRVLRLFGRIEMIFILGEPVDREESYLRGRSDEVIQKETRVSDHNEAAYRGIFAAAAAKGPSLVLR